jgi:prepilin-type N-terminal cleavage/methylation domain-containing protein
METRGFLKEEKGFTLVEIIATLVVLGILAMVAVPKYMNLMDDAGKKAALGAVAEGQARVNLYAAKQLLSNGSITAGQFTTENLGDDAGDFTLAFTTAAAGVSVGATATNNASYNATGFASFPTD